MEILIIIAMSICMLTSLFFTVAKLTGPVLFQIPARLLGIMGVVIPILYFFNLFKLIHIP